MSNLKKAVIIIRILSFLAGTIIVSWFAYLYMVMISKYPDANFWYFTHTTSVNLNLALIFHFALFVLMLFPIYPPKSLLGSILALSGATFFALGRAYTVPVTGFFYWHGIDEPGGLVMMLIGAILIFLGYRHNRSSGQSISRNPLHLDSRSSVASE